jgi:hypothetical protein
MNGIVALSDRQEAETPAERAFRVMGAAGFEPATSRV